MIFFFLSFEYMTAHIGNKNIQTCGYSYKKCKRSVQEPLSLVTKFDLLDFRSKLWERAKEMRF